MLNAYLSGAEDVSSGMKGNADVVDRPFLAVDNCGNRSCWAEPGAENFLTFRAAHVGLAAPSRVVAVRVGYQRAFNRLPRINVKITSFAIQSAVGDAEQISSRIAQEDGRAGGTPPNALMIASPMLAIVSCGSLSRIHRWSAFSFVMTHATTRLRRYHSVHSVRTASVSPSL